MLKKEQVKQRKIDTLLEMMRKLFLFILVCHSSVLCAQNSDYQIFHYTINDGLPSNECHDVVMDQNGYLWIATDRGLSRYDGYGFKNYGREKGLNDLSCLDLFADKHGSIWIATLSRKIFVYNPESDRIEEYKYNDDIRIINKRNVPLRDLYVDSLGSLTVNLRGSGLFKIDASGEISNFSQEIRERYHIHFVEGHPFLAATTFGSDVDVKRNLNINGKQLNVNPTRKKIYGHAKVLKIKKDEFYLGLLGYNYLIKDDSFIMVEESPTFHDLHQLVDGKYVTGQLFNEGLKIYENEEDLFTGQYDVLIPDVSVSSILLRGKNIFLSSTNYGFYFLKKRKDKTLNNIGLSTGKITALSVSARGILYGIVDEEKILRYDMNNDIVQNIELPIGEAHSLFYHDNLGGLFLGGIPFSFYFDEKEIQEKSKMMPQPQSRVEIQAKSIFWADSLGVLLTNGGGFFEYQDLRDSVIFRSIDHNFRMRCNVLLRLIRILI